MRTLLVLLLVLLVLVVEGADLYAALGVSPDADERGLKKAYRKVALENHPDKQKDKTEEEKQRATDLFIAASNAFDVLSDPEKRNIYDAYGEAGLKKSQQQQQQRQGAASGFGGYRARDPMEIFEAMFGGAFGGGGAQVFMDESGRIFMQAGASGAQRHSRAQAQAQAQAQNQAQYLREAARAQEKVRAQQQARQAEFDAEARAMLRSSTRSVEQR